MFRLISLGFAVAACICLVPSVAPAKGPSEAAIEGPGLAGPVQLPSAGQASSSFWTIVDHIGFFPAVFGQSPDPMLSERPRGSLGPTAPRSTTTGRGGSQATAAPCRPEWPRATRR